MNGDYEGSITITINSGKQVKGFGSVSFAPAAVTFAGVSYLRGDVKEVLIRRPRPDCCEALAVGVFPLAILIGSIGNREIAKEDIALIAAVSPVIVGAAAVTGPPFLIIEGFRRLKPAEVLYKVGP